MKYDIFISYRRDGGDTLSQLIYDRLTRRGYRVFLDIESLNAGKFNEKLLEVIEECRDIVVVLPPNGLDRCNNEGDWLYRELEHGMKHSKNIIPVLMKNFEWPEIIPAEIAEIKNYNGIVDNKDYFDAVIDKLTTLLKSKPFIGGNMLKTVGERSRIIKDRIKRKKQIIVGLLVLIFLCVTSVFLKKNMENKNREEERQNTKIILTPSEEMSASEYYDAIDIIKERIDILADGKKYSFAENDGKIYITIPMDVFHDVKIEVALECYVTWPTEIYLTGDWVNEPKEEDKCFHIERSAIKNIELVDEAPVDVDFESYKVLGIENEEDCQYFAVTIDSEVAKRAKEWVERTNFSDYGLYQDYDEFGKSVYCYLAGVFESDNTLYFVNHYQYSNYLNLVLYNYQNETFSNAFYYSIEYPVNWEYEDSKAEIAPYMYGENQCDVDEISEDLIARYDFKSLYDEFTEGEYYDIIIAFKKRLDALGIPYAFGTYTTDPYNVVVKLNPNYMNSFIQKYIGNNYKIMIRTKFYEVLDRFDVEKIEISKNENDSYHMEIVPSEDWFTKYNKENIVSELEGEEEIFLCIADDNGIPVTKSTLEESFDGKKFVFDNFSLFGAEEINERNKYFAEFLKVLHETEMPTSYLVSGIYEEFEQNEIQQVMDEPIVLTTVRERYEKAIETLETVEEYNVIVDDFGQTVELEVVCPESQSYVEYVNETFQKLYDYCKMNDGEIGNIEIAFYYGSKGGKCTYLFLRKSLYEHCMRLSGSYHYDGEADVKEAFDQMFNEDSFYKQFTIRDIYKEDGYIRFQ